MTLETNSKYASIKLLEEEEYSPKQITRTINLNQEIEEVQEGIELNIQIQAEDGTIENHTITIVKTGNANIKTVKIEGQEIINQKDTYTGRINIAQTAEIEITSQNERAKNRNNRNKNRRKRRRTRRNSNKWNRDNKHKHTNKRKSTKI